MFRRCRAAARTMASPCRPRAKKVLDIARGYQLSQALYALRSWAWPTRSTRSH